MAQIVLQLGGAVDVGAAGDCLVFETYGAGTADRALGWKGVFARPFRAFRFHDLDDLRDHVPRALYHHRVADPDVLAFDFALVVQ